MLYNINLRQANLYAHINSTASEYSIAVLGNPANKWTKRRKGNTILVLSEFLKILNAV